MKILIIGPAYPYRGGIASFNEVLAREFNKQGHKTEIHTFSLQYPSILFPGKTQYVEGEAPNDLIIHRSINSINPFNWLKVGNIIKKQKFDIVLFRYWLPFMAPSLGTIARLIKKNRTTKVLALADNIIPHEKRIGDNSLTQYFVNSIDGFLVMSKTVRNDLKYFSKTKKCRFSFHPILNTFEKKISKNEALTNLNLDTNYSYLLFFGLIRDYKGLDIALKAITDERIKKMPLKLLVTGEFYSDRKKYDDFINSYNLHERVIITDKYIPDNQVHNWFCAADAILQPYKTATQSGVTQIAYHFEKPMIVTNVGGLEEMVSNNKVGYVVDPAANNVADAIVNLYQNNKLNEFSVNAANEKEKFSWEKITNEIISLYNDCI